MPRFIADARWRSLAGLGGAATCLLLLSSPGGAVAQDASRGGAAAQNAQVDTRITEADCRNRAKSDREIVVCGQRTEDPYRIPKAFRGKPRQEPRTGTALAVDVMGSGIPGAGSNIGAAGSAGQSKGLYEQWLAEKNAAKKAAEVPR